MSRNKITVSEWVSAFGQAEKMSRVVPEGWKTIRQIAEETGRSVCSTHKHVKGLACEGKVEVRKFMVPTDSRGYYPVPHYRIVKVSKA